MKRTLAYAAAVAAAVIATLIPSTAAQAAWNDVLSQSQMITQWCNGHHYAFGYGNWSDGYYCKQTGYSPVRQTTAPGDMCRWLLGDSTVSFHIILPTSSKNGACGYWY